MARLSHASSGSKVSRAYDYIFRPLQLEVHDPLFVVENYERVTLKSMLRSRTASHDDAVSSDELDDSDDDEDSPVLPDSCLSFLEDHPSRTRTASRS